MKRNPLGPTGGFLLGFFAGLCLSIWAIGVPLHDSATELREAARQANEVAKRLELMFKP